MGAAAQAADGAAEHTPLHWAALRGDVREIDALLARGAAVEARSRANEQLGQTPLHWACVSGHVPVTRALLARGADPAARDACGYDALMHACMYGHVGCVDSLLRARSGELCRARDADGHAALHWGAHFGHVAVVCYLLRVAGADVDPVDDSGATPLHRAARRGHAGVCELLLQAGADPAACDADGHDAKESAAGGGTRQVVVEAEFARAREGALAPRRVLRRMRRAGPAACFYVVGGLGYWKYITFVLVRWPAPFAHTVVLHALLGLAVASAAACSLRDPGFLARGTPDAFQGVVKAAADAGSVERDLDPMGYCFFCLVRMPPRSRHCRDVGRCVVRFDHYCPFMGNNIGVRNHHALFVHAVSVSLTSALFLYGVVRAFQVEANRGVDLVDVLSEHGFLCLISFAVCVFMCFAAGLVVNQVQLILTNQTTFSQMLRMRNEGSRNPLDRGWRQNVMEFVTMTGPPIPSDDDGYLSLA